MVICLERDADLHMAQLMPLPFTVSCFSKIQIGFTFLVPAHLDSPGKGSLNGCVCVFCKENILPYKQGSFRAGTHRNAVPVLFLITGTPFRSFSAYSCKI